jgi:hypothetical protein
MITSESSALVEHMPMLRVTVQDRKLICKHSCARICGFAFHALLSLAVALSCNEKLIGHVCYAMIGRVPAVLIHSLCGTRVGRVAYASELQGQLTSQVVQQASRVRLIECTSLVRLGARMICVRRAYGCAVRICVLTRALLSAAPCFSLCKRTVHDHFECAGRKATHVMLFGAGAFSGVSVDATSQVGILSWSMASTRARMKRQSGSWRHQTAS